MGTNDIAITAYPGEVIDYDVTVFLKQDPPGTPKGVVVCPIFNGTLTLVLPDGSGPFTLDTNISLPIGGSGTYQNVPAGQKYTMNTADVSPARCPSGCDATAHVEATAPASTAIQRPDDERRRPVEATATAPTFLLAPSTAMTVTPEPARHPGRPGRGVDDHRDQRHAAQVLPAPPLTAVHVDLSTDGGATTFVSVDLTTPGFSGDTNGNQLLDVGENWTWVVSTNPTANTTVTATGFGNGPRAHVVTFPADAEERAAAPVQVSPPPPPPAAPPPAPPPVDAAAAAAHRRRHPARRLRDHRPGPRPDRRRPRARHPAPASDVVLTAPPS